MWVGLRAPSLRTLFANYSLVLDKAIGIDVRNWMIKFALQFSVWHLCFVILIKYQKKKYILVATLFYIGFRKYNYFCTLIMQIWVPILFCKFLQKSTKSMSKTYQTKQIIYINLIFNKCYTHCIWNKKIIKRYIKLYYFFHEKLSNLIYNLAL